MTSISVGDSFFKSGQGQAEVPGLLNSGILPQPHHPTGPSDLGSCPLPFHGLGKHHADLGSPAPSWRFQVTSCSWAECSCLQGASQSFWQPESILFVSQRPKGKGMKTPAICTAVASLLLLSKIIPSTALKCGLEGETVCKARKREESNIS